MTGEVQLAQNPERSLEDLAMVDDFLAILHGERDASNRELSELTANTIENLGTKAIYGTSPYIHGPGPYTRFMPHHK